MAFSEIEWACIVEYVNALANKLKAGFFGPRFNFLPFFYEINACGDDTIAGF